MGGTVSDGHTADDPHWIASSLRLTAGRDPIGLQTITIDRIMPRLVPSILALSQRARYFSIYPFLLLAYEERKLSPTNRGLSDFIRAREFEYALAVQHCPHCRSTPSGVVGKQAAGPIASSAGDPLPRGLSVESHLGGYGLYYRTPLVSLDVVAPAGSTYGDGDVTPVDVVNHGLGRDLAAAYRQAIASTDYFQNYMDSERPIPRSVLADLANVACLCRLPDFPAEQDLIRRALFTASPTQPPGEIDQRRRSFALTLWLGGASPVALDSNEEFRRAIWTSFQFCSASPNNLFETLGQWAALIAKETAQDALSMIWLSFCQAGQHRQQPDGVTPTELDRLIRDDLVGAGTIVVGDSRIDYDRQTNTEDLRHSLREATSILDLERLRADLTVDASPVSGLALLLILRDRLPSPADSPRGWSDIARQGAQWQPGLLGLMHQLDLHQEEHPTIGDTIAWLIRTRIITVHQRVAFGKLPEFTFRFRWENDRLKFYTWFKPERFELTDIRRVAIARLSEDIGFWSRDDDGVPRLTSIGSRFVTEVFS